MNIVIIGIGALAEALIARINQIGSDRVTCMVDTGPGSQSLHNQADRVGSEYIRTSNLKNTALLERLSAMAPDYIISADNPVIFGVKLLRTARRACINFHNAPLPAYRGLNIPTWVIWQQESRHGISWHLMLEEIDSGEVILQRKFPLDATESAFSLSLKCIQAGIDSVSSLLEKLPDYQPNHTQAGSSNGRYYSRKDIPHNGLMSESWNACELERFFRAFHYRTIPNHVGHPRWSCAGSIVDVKRLERLPLNKTRPCLKDNQVLLDRPDGLVLLTLATQH